jgi:demethylmenaquinone methyltransferase / 2-methoxy-6-polyprenyl-1,4-benzoquinol methylase
VDHNRTAGELEHAKAVRAMFAGIAGRYDLLNHILSANIDKRWRRKVRAELADVLANEDAVVLDVACGTGDLAIELQRDARAKVIGTDFCRPMLSVACDKAPEIAFVEGDAMNLSFADGSFDAVTIAFGLRNLSNFRGGLNELYRVLKSGGRLVILEFSSPVVPGFRGAFRFYFSNILPRIGGWISGERGAYEYLPDSVSKFPDQKALAAMMQETGLKNISYKNLTGGIAAIHLGEKHPDADRIEKGVSCL